MGKKNRRHIIQAVWTALSNGYVFGYAEGRIYTGSTKKICLPGLNCYSCPGAFGACPIGSLQATLSAGHFRALCYVMGFLLLFGSILGRVVCGFFCPFGFVQDLLYKVPVFQKKKNFKGHRILTKMKYVVLLVFVILLPLLVRNEAGSGAPWFCEWICPSGTLMGGIPLLALDASLREAAGFRYAWKILLLLVAVLLSVKWYRPFCKYVCPLGAYYGLFNGFSLYRYQIDTEKCNQCASCQTVCKMAIPVWETPNSPECIRCGGCRRACPRQAICRRKTDGICG